VISIHERPVWWCNSCSEKPREGALSRLKIILYNIIYNPNPFLCSSFPGGGARSTEVTVRCGYERIWILWFYFLILLLLSYFSEPRANDPTRQKNYQKLDSRSIQLMTFILRLAVYHHRNLETNKNIMDYLGNHSLFLGCFTSQIIHDNKDNKMNLISNNISF